MVMYKSEELPLDDEETLKLFGYLASSLSPGSNKKVVYRCVMCKECFSTRRCGILPGHKCRKCGAKNNSYCEERRREARLSWDNSLGIDVEKTIQKYGYNPMDLQKKSGKLVVQVCTVCLISRDVRRCDLCKSTRCQKCACKDPLHKDKISQGSKLSWSNNRSDILKKRKDTLSKNFGEAGSAHPSITQKKKETLSKNFGEAGMAHPSIRQKHEETLSKNFGEAGMAHPSITQKFKETLSKNFGEAGSAHPSIRQKFKETLYKNFGEAGLAHPSIIQKKKETLSKNFGEAGLTHPSITQKREATIFAKYGDKGFPRTNNFGASETEVRTFIENLVKLQTIKNKILSNGQHIDIYLSELNLGIEYNGLHWHNEESPQPRLKKYHYTKWKLLTDNGDRLISIWEDEWKERRHAIEGVLKAAVHVYDKVIGARKCEIREVPLKESRDFMDLEHVQGGSRRSKKAWALFYENKIVAAVTASEHHRQGHKDILVLDRLCFPNGIHIPGGASRLLKPLVNYAKSCGKSQIVTWADNRYATGKVYQALGFIKEKELGPDYEYVEINHPKKRFSKQSQKKSSTGCPPEITEIEWTKQHGLARIWDCGKTRWVLPINT